MSLFRTVSEIDIGRK